MRRRTAATGAAFLFAAGLGGCAPPAVDADDVRIDSGGDTEFWILPPESTEFDDARLLMPHLGVASQEVAVTDRLTGSYATALGYDGDVSAAEGQEFVVVVLERQQSPYDVADGTPVAVIESSGTSTDITRALAEDPKVAVSMSVDAGAPVALTITDEDRSAQLDLRTGAVIDDAGASSYYGDGAIELTGSLSATTTIGSEDRNVQALFEPDRAEIAVDLDDAVAARHEWLAGVGWAEEGQDFLVITGIFTNVSSGTSGCFASWGDAAITLAPDGAEATGTVGSGVAAQGAAADGSLVFSIPEGATAGTLRLAPTWSANDGCTTWDPSGPSELEIALPAS